MWGKAGGSTPDGPLSPCTATGAATLSLRAENPDCVKALLVQPPYSSSQSQSSPRSNTELLQSPLLLQIATPSRCYVRWYVELTCTPGHGRTFSRHHRAPPRACVWLVQLVRNHHRHHLHHHFLLVRLRLLAPSWGRDTLTPLGAESHTLAIQAYSATLSFPSPIGPPPM